MPIEIRELVIKASASRRRKRRRCRPPPWPSCASNCCANASSGVLEQLADADRR